MLLIEVDPRACGVDYYKILVVSTGNGGSPRMRGRLFVYFLLLIICRWIPAHAG